MMAAPLKSCGVALAALFALSGLFACDGPDAPSAGSPTPGVDCEGREARQGCPCEAFDEAVCDDTPGACNYGWRICQEDGTWSGCQGEELPVEEVCDGLDNDCDGEADEGLRNACEGCGDLGGHTFNSPCGTCDSGRWLCRDEETLICSGDRGQTAHNGCGGCEVLKGEPAAPCGTCGSGVWACEGVNGVVCQGDQGEQAYGPCGDCEVAGSACGTCDSGVWTCEPPGPSVCLGDMGDTALNVCGGCAELVGELGAACGACETGVWVCDGTEGLWCEGDRGARVLNGCGGCESLDALPGTGCGTCNLGRWVCEGVDAVFCEGELGEGAYDACGGCSGLLEIQVGEPCRSCGEYVCQDDVLICVPTDACDPNRVQTLVPDIELQNVGCVLGPVDVNGDGIHDLAVDTRVYFGPISAGTINSRSPDVCFFQGHSDTAHTAVKAYEDLNGDGHMDAIMSFEDSYATYRYNPLMVVWGPLSGRHCVDLCPVSPEVADSPLCPSGRYSDCQCNVDKDASTPAVCIYRDEIFNFEFSQFVGGPYDYNGAGCKMPDGLLTGDVNGDGYTDIIHVVNCDPNDRTCEFSRIRIDLGPNTPDSDSCFLNPSVSECEVEFDVQDIQHQADVYLIEDVDGDGSDEFIIRREYFSGLYVEDFNELYLGPVEADGLGGRASRVLPGYSASSYFPYVSLGDIDSDGREDIGISSQVREVANVFLTQGESISGFPSLRITGDSACHGVLKSVGDIDVDGVDDLLVVCAWAAVFYGPVAPGQFDYRLADWYVEFQENQTPSYRFTVLGDINSDGRVDWAYPLGTALWIQFGPSRERR